MGGARRGRPASDALPSIAGATGVSEPVRAPEGLTRVRVGAEDMREFIAGLGLPAEVEGAFLP